MQASHLSTLAIQCHRWVDSGEGAPRATAGSVAEQVRPDSSQALMVTPGSPLLFGMQDPAAASNIQNGPNMGDQYLDVERLAAQVSPP